MNGDPITKLGTILLVVLGCFLGYRFLHPSTTFAADGTDPGWDAAVYRRDCTEPTVVLFTAAWCPACRGLEANVLSRSDVQYELAHHYNVYTVDLTSPSPVVQAHAGKLGISAIPTMIRYDAAGHEQSRMHSGSAEMVMEWLKAGE